MRVSDLVSELHNSTKAILIACSAFLVVTASVLLFLMLFPIQAKDPAVNAVMFTTETTSTTTTAQLEEVGFTTKEPLHTLSTWGVSIETMPTTRKPDPTTTAWYDAIFTKKPMGSDADFHSDYNYHQPGQDFITTQPVDPDSGESDIPLTDSFTDSPVQTVTEVQQQIPDVPAPTDAPPSVVTDPPVTAPANMDHSNSDGYAAEPQSPAPSPAPTPSPAPAEPDVPAPDPVQPVAPEISE
ncbi:MAG: hypothetical protein K2H82_04880 [Oscillospiraceae bacterium]|nr:hypothetical protein [Oscillospiraceae bacterium]